MALGEPDASGRRQPEPIAGSEFIIEADMAIEAIGQSANKVLFETYPELALTNRGYLAVADNSCQTSVPGIFAGGDIVTGAATVILAKGLGN